MSITYDIVFMQQRLKDAVDNEDYEEAARLRDLIDACLAPSKKQEDTPRVAGLSTSTMYAPLSWLDPTPFEKKYVPAPEVSEFKEQHRRLREIQNQRAQHDAIRNARKRINAIEGREVHDGEYAQHAFRVIDKTRNCDQFFWKTKCVMVMYYMTDPPYFVFPE
jgi:hypothetical protein